MSSSVLSDDVLNDISLTLTAKLLGIEEDEQSARTRFWEEFVSRYCLMAVTYDGVRYWATDRFRKKSIIDRETPIATIVNMILTPKFLTRLSPTAWFMLMEIL